MVLHGSPGEIIHLPVRSFSARWVCCSNRLNSQLRNRNRWVDSRSDWTGLFARRLHRYPQVEKVMIIDFDFAEEVAGAAERLVGSRGDATALQRWSETQ